MTTNPSTPLAGILTPLARAWTYAILAIVVPSTSVIVAVMQDGWQWADLAIILPAVASSAGFTMAHNNVRDTEVELPPPPPVDPRLPDPYD